MSYKLLAPLQQSGPVTINYTYDPLNRLTAADYSTGAYYHYTYDSVGNRLTQETGLGTTAYTYDLANRLTSVNGQNYTWDNNGNLLNDGVNTYAYDSADRLTAISGQQSASFAYNGLGDRLTQNGVNYTLDLNAGLTQVLGDGTNTYLYGVGRIAQVNTSTEYFLGDALGSVRQLTDASGEITLAKSYAPYGEAMSSAGSGTSPFAFTGEQQDVSGLTYLRARYYAGDVGRFLTRDTWMGDTNSPLSLNRWMYVEGNPVNLTDPSGHVPCYMLPPDDQVNCIAVPPPPDWWINQTQLYVNGFGYFDSGHLKRGWIGAEFFVKEIEATLNRGGGVFKNPALSKKWNQQKQEYEVVYLAYYSISAKVSKDRNGRFDRDQILGLAYGMYMDFERGYEEYQYSKIFPLNLSGFGPADLPSDHLGFWAYMNGYERDEIPALLQCLGNVHVLGGKLSSVVFDSYGIAENHEFLPMIMDTVHLGRATVYRTRNIAWPAFLEIQPIPSGPNTWQRGVDWHK